MKLGYEKPLYMLAFDHRGCFQRDLFGVEGDLTPADAERVADAKRLIFEIAGANGVDRDSAGLLVDEQFASAAGCSCSSCSRPLPRRSSRQWVAMPRATTSRRRTRLHRIRTRPHAVVERAVRVRGRDTRSR